MSTLNYYGSDPSGTKLPFWKTVGAAYAAVFENFAALLKASWLWLILAAVLTANTMWTAAPWQAEVMAALMKQQPVPPAPWQLTALQAASTIAMGIGGVSMAVAWHRLLLLGEQPSILGNFFTPASFGAMLSREWRLPLSPSFLSWCWASRHGGSMALNCPWR